MRAHTRPRRPRLINPAATAAPRGKVRHGVGNHPWQTAQPTLPGPRTQVGLAVLIPAYQPDARLPRLVATLRRDLGCAALVVDDGSGPQWAGVFKECRAQGATVLTYPHNAGKGYALRNGLAQAARRWPEADVVCADADGQHTPADIAAVARRVHDTRHMTLGVREFVGDVPLRSRIGNDATALLFRGATGWRLGDTQTGLRGYPAGRFAWMLGVPGDRYEYELAALLEAAERGIEVEEVPIATVYEAGNASSHFRPLQDSARIYAPLLRYMGERALRRLHALLRSRPASGEQ